MQLFIYFYQQQCIFPETNPKFWIIHRPQCEQFSLDLLSPEEIVPMKAVAGLFRFKHLDILLDGGRNLKTWTKNTKLFAWLHTIGCK